MRLSQEREIPKPVLYGVVAAAVIGAVVYVSWSVSGSSSGSPEVHYPYWCDQCKAVYDVEELKEDPPNTWRIAPGGGSDSVVVCIKCDKGRAFPAIPCRTCKKHFLLHIIPNAECPHCDPKAAEAAKAAGVNLTPPELSK